MRCFIGMCLVVSLCSAFTPAPAASAGSLVGVDVMTATVMQEKQSSFSGIALRTRIKSPRLIQGVEVLPTPVWVLQTPAISASQVTLRWTGPAGGLLETAGSVLGPWATVPGQSNHSALLPFTNGLPTQFLRVRGN